MTILSALWLVPLAAFVLVCVVLILLWRRATVIQAGAARRRYWLSVLVLIGVVAVVRVVICWNLAYRAFRHTEKLSEVPLIALLMPEYLLTPGDPSTPEGMWALTAALVVGTSIGISVMALVVWGSRRAS